MYTNTHISYIYIYTHAYIHTYVHACVRTYALYIYYTHNVHMQICRYIDI